MMTRVIMGRQNQYGVEYKVWLAISWAGEVLQAVLTDEPDIRDSWDGLLQSRPPDVHPVQG